MNLSSLKGTEVAFYKEMAIVSTFSEYYCPLHSKHSQFFMNYFITFQNYNFITKQICFVIPGLDILQSKHSKQCQICMQVTSIVLSVQIRTSFNN